MLTIKAFHIILVVSWFAGLFYLPRIYVNLAAITDTQSAEYQRLLASPAYTAAVAKYQSRLGGK